MTRFPFTHDATKRTGCWSIVQADGFFLSLANQFGGNLTAKVSSVSLYKWSWRVSIRSVQNYLKREKRKKYQKGKKIGKFQGGKMGSGP